MLQDTAGVREAGDEVERIGIGRTLSNVAEAELLIAVFDSSRPFEDDDARVLELCRGRPASRYSTNPTCGRRRSRPPTFWNGAWGCR